MQSSNSDTHERVERLARVAKALSDPVRIHMLKLMGRESECCPPEAEDLQPLRARIAFPQTRPPGVCVCELQQLLGLAQSRVSYHLKILKAAGLISETTRGKWTFYALDAGAFRAALALYDELILGRTGR